MCSPVRQRPRGSVLPVPYHLTHARPSHLARPRLWLLLRPLLYFEPVVPVSLPWHELPHAETGRSNDERPRGPVPVVPRGTRASRAASVTWQPGHRLWSCGGAGTLRQHVLSTPRYGEARRQYWFPGWGYRYQSGPWRN